MRTAPQNYYIFKASNGSQVKVLRGTAAPKITGGEGGWTTIDRPRRVGLTQWDGHTPYTMDVPIMFDGFQDGTSVERDIRVFNLMAMGRDFTPPPTVTIEGALPVAGATWVIEGIDWGDMVYWDVSPRGRYYRIRQDAVAHMLQYEAVKTLKIVVPKQLPNAYTPNRTMTLKEVSKAVYGNGTHWKEIQKANPSIRDMNKVPKGKRLRIP